MSFFSRNKPQGPCNSDKCNCPDCVSARMKQINLVEERIERACRPMGEIDRAVARNVRMEMMHREKGLDMQVRDIIHKERAEHIMASKARVPLRETWRAAHPEVVKAWRAAAQQIAVYPWPPGMGGNHTYEWAKLPDGFQRRNKKSGELYGPICPMDRWRDWLNTKPYYVMAVTEGGDVKATIDVDSKTVGDVSKTDAHIVVEGNPTSAGEFTRAIFDEPDLIPAFLPKWATPAGFNDEMPIYKRTLAADTAQRNAGPTWAEQMETDPMLTKLQLAILLHRYAYPGTDVRFEHPERSVVRAAVESLESQALIEITSPLGSRQHIELSYKLAARGEVFCKALWEMPLPIRQEAPWTMPAAGVRGAC